MSKKTAPAKRPSISQADLDAWLDSLAQSQTLIAPREVSDVLVYRQVGNSGEIARDFTRPLLPVKEVLFPPTESMLSIKKTGAEIRVSETLPEGKAVVFGVRPCDARGARLLDALFIDTAPADPYYARRRENTALIGLACKSMGPSCFCTSVGGAPDDPTGTDLMLTPVDDGYLVEAITPKGHTLLADSGWEESVDGGLAQAKGERFPVPEKGAWTKQFESPIWADLSEGCLSCRACAYACPTCRCFAVRDEMLATGQFERIRCWDSCAGANYRRVAGGHRPRPEKAERLRNRIYCKFFYFPEQAGLVDTSACTGCGRCIDICPAGVDITEVLLELGRQP
jgi:sulfhydrogenase subunit beta (sulfur reductase)